jgi:hypothetical protein
VVLMCSICKKDVSCDQSADVNCVPLSEVIVWGTPNLVIQVEQNASAQAEAVVEDRGTASAHRVVRSTMVKCVCFLVKVAVDLQYLYVRGKNGVQV